MAFLVASGSICQCSCGACPSVFSCLPSDLVLTGGMPASSIFDCIPMLNIKPFGACGITGFPCAFAPAGTWIPTNPMIAIKGKPILLSDSILACSIGGVIRILSPSQVMAHT